MSTETITESLDITSSAGDAIVNQLLTALNKSKPGHELKAVMFTSTLGLTITLPELTYDLEGRAGDFAYGIMQLLNDHGIEAISSFEHRYEYQTDKQTVISIVDGTTLNITFGLVADRKIEGQRLQILNLIIGNIDAIYTFAKQSAIIRSLESLNEELGIQNYGITFKDGKYVLREALVVNNEFAVKKEVQQRGELLAQFLQLAPSDGFHWSAVETPLAESRHTHLDWWIGTVGLDVRISEEMAKAMITRGAEALIEDMRQVKEQIKAATQAK